MFLRTEKRGGWVIIGSFLLTITLLLLLQQTLAAAASVPADLSGSQKLVDRATAHPGDMLHYTIVISNSSATSVTAVLTDALPTGLLYQTGSLTATSATDFDASSQLITWTGTLMAQEAVTVSFAAAISTSLTVGESVMNTAVISGNGQTISRTATTDLVDYSLHLPFIARPLSALTLQPILLACGATTWTVTWSSGHSGVTYELQEDRDPNFTNPTSYTTGNTSQAIDHPPTTDDVYYYRVRSMTGTSLGPWSNIVSLIGPYLDNFSDPTSGWAATETNISKLGYNNGEYYVRTKDTGNSNNLYLATSLPGMVNRTNYILEADVHWQSGVSREGLYGLLFGSNNDASKFFFAALFPDLHGYRVFYFDNTLPVSDRLIAVSDYKTDPAIKAGTAVNHVRIEHINQTIELNVNGVVLGSWANNFQSGPSRTGVIAVAINPGNHPVVEARFDNFKMNTCNSGNAMTRQPGLRTTAVTTQPPFIVPEALFDNSK